MLVEEEEEDVELLQLSVVIVPSCTCCGTMPENWAKTEWRFIIAVFLYICVCVFECVILCVSSTCVVNPVVCLVDGIIFVKK